MKVMKYFAVASLALFAACNNEENPVAPESGNQPVDVVMSVALPGPDTCRHGRIAEHRQQR